MLIKTKHDFIFKTYIYRPNTDDHKVLTPMPQQGGSKMNRPFASPSWTSRDQLSGGDDSPPPPFLYKQPISDDRY